MHIKEITIENLRNIKFAKISPNQKINFIVGDNGAGKTSILESIYLLARARSFRQKKSGRLINDDEDQLNLFARIETTNKTKHQIGFQLKTNQTTIRIDGENLKKLSTLAQSLPLTIITPNIQRLIEEDPTQRRRLLNWGMFHVEHEYGELANRYRKALVQRNNALRSSVAQLKVWDDQLIDLGSKIHQKMVDYTIMWNQTFNEMLAELALIEPISLLLRQGWREELSLQEAMERNLRVDQERGFTSSGPHRSDLRIMQHGKPIKNMFSRGEAKIAAVLMLLSQTAITERKTGESPVLLVDDLHSELDSARYRGLISLISKQRLQSFITTLQIDRSEIPIEDDACRVFHVEHGQVRDC